MGSVMDKLDVMLAVGFVMIASYSTGSLIMSLIKLNSLLGQ